MVKIVRSKRKTLAIYILKDASVEVRAPLDMPLRHIERFVDSKERWISDRVSRRARSIDAKFAFSLNYGDQVLLRGKLYPIKAVEKSGLSRAGFDGEYLLAPPGLSSDMIKKAVISIYTDEANKTLREKTRAFAERMGIQYRGLRVTGAKTRWGSCSSKASLCFSWRLIMAPDDVIDYVVVHELAHIREMNHSPRFWALVSCVIPDYPDKKKKLRQLHESLASQDWS